MTNKELQEKKKRLVYMNQKEYKTHGNTKRCQELFEEIQKIEKEINSKKKSTHS